MASATEIRHHIAAVEQTQKITGAMEMVSSTRIKRVMTHIEQNRRYFDNVQRTMREILASANDITHPYLQDVPPDSHCTFIVISGDKGLCGSYNHNVLQLAYDKIIDRPKHSIMTIGNTAEDFFRSKGMPPDITVLGIAQDPALSRARILIRDIMNMYDSGETSEIQIVYTSFYGETKNKPIVRRLLPIRLDDYMEIRDAEQLREVIFHPSAQEVFDLLVPQYILGLLFGMMVQAYAGEHFARMTAMHNSTTNATDMLKGLRTKYNMARQSAITNEIAEITGAAEILRGGDR
ncbi:F-type H+-transporting ATPase subunit gamma [Sporobacter termitidis DSM 10068]|uniref:ATP synthase gamma chain n=1 Tax=Sporobacter termitidis DSM 10068 TaxID=1123282 RepID=A0A1M5VUE9_9FIRM|nr:ATP synthase F1 subunit gamma [Sporobacter termitidis]SHH78543.1 F-type H+-transporting ATPase subunit gamma [Sporobacter termitidis DSM 10068]